MKNAYKKRNKTHYQQKKRKQRREDLDAEQEGAEEINAGSEFQINGKFITGKLKASIW